MSILATSILAGCASNTVTNSLKPVPTGSDRLAVLPGSTVPVYSKLAAGLHACWLRDGKPLSGTHILHAKVAPPPSNSADVIVHLKSPTGRPGLKAFSINLLTFGDQTRAIMTNHKLTKTAAAQLVLDIDRWGRGDPSCSDVVGGIPVPIRVPPRGARKKGQAI